MNNPYKGIPFGNNGAVMVNHQSPYVAITQNMSENNVASSVITFDDNTTIIEVAATGQAAYLKWIATGNTNPSVFGAAGTANFDHVIQANSFRCFAIPIESAPSYSIVGANVQNGLYRRMALASNGAGSVLTTQY